MLEISLNMYHAVALGAFLFWLGGVITSKISLLNRYCIPAPLVGGLCFSIVNCILYSTGAASITFDDTLQSVFMIMFFTTVGFTVSIPALLKGGKAVLLCLLVAVVMIPVQNFLGGGVMALFGKDPLLGIGCGSIALVGGPGTAAAYGPELEAAGAVGGSVVSIAAATFGLVAGSLMGGPTARRLINKYGLRPDSASLRASAPSAGAHHLQHRALGPLTQGSGYIPPVSSRERPPTVRGPLPAAFSPPPQARAPGFSAGLSCFSGPFRV